MTVTVTKVNFDTLPTAEQAAIRAAEAEAAEFYGNIEKEETERVRLTELKKMCGLMWNNRYTATELVTAELNDNTLFTASEKTVILTSAKNLHPEAEHRSAMNALHFITSVSNLHKTMKTGYYFENFPATELLVKHGA